MKLFDLYGALPAAGDRHLAEFFPYFLTRRDRLGRRGRRRLDDDSESQNTGCVGARSRAAAQSAASCRRVTRSPEATADIVSAVANGRSMRTIVNLPNTGQIDNLPRGAVVETLAEITARPAPSR